MTARKLHFKLFNGGGAHRAGDAQIDLQDQIDDLKMQLEFMSKLASGRKGLIRRLSEDVQQRSVQIESLGEQLTRARAELDHLRATCRRQAQQVESGDPDSTTTQELNLAEAAPLVVDFNQAITPVKPSKALTTPTSPAAIPQLMVGATKSRRVAQVVPLQSRKELL